MHCLSAERGEIKRHWPQIKKNDVLTLVLSMYLCTYLCIYVGALKRATNLELNFINYVVSFLITYIP
jgi:hypothetical protein